MLLNDLLCESSMSEIAEFWHEFDQLDSAMVDWDLGTHTMYVSFVMQGTPGTMRLRLKPQPDDNSGDRSFRRRLWAAAVSDRRGAKPTSWSAALQGLRGRVRRHALALLTDRSKFELLRLRWQHISVG